MVFLCLEREQQQLLPSFTFLGLVNLASVHREGATTVVAVVHLPRAPLCTFEFGREHPQLWASFTFPEPASTVSAQQLVTFIGKSRHTPFRFDHRSRLPTYAFSLQECLLIS